MKISERRIRDFALGVLLVLTAYALVGCDGQGPEGDVPDGSAGVVKKSDAGVTYCDIPSPSGDVKLLDSRGNATSMTMRQYYEGAAASGSAGYWGKVSNLGEFAGLCAGTSASSADCQGPAKDPSAYCYYASCSWSADKSTQVCELDGRVGRWAGDTRLVTAALCTPAGAFAGWLCKECVGSSGCAHL